MNIRVVNGNTSTEDGWPLVDQAGCTWVTIPGTDPPVNIEVQSGIPAIVFRAWVADLNAFVEKVRDGDTASWTEGNSVLGGYGQNNGSNHLGGTAVDVDWNDHPMGPAYAGYTQAEINEIRAMREFYKLDDGTYLVFWAEDWDTPKDSMHFQMDYGTYDKRAAIQQWIDTHIHADGFSTYRRGDQPPAPAPQHNPSTDQIDVLAAAAGIPKAKAIEILPTLSAGLQLAQCNTVNRIAMFIAQTCWEADRYKTTQEYGDLSGEAFYPYIGRTWIQITWQSNYAAFGQWCVDNGLITDPNQFVNDPQSLADIQWAGIGAAWYWTVQRPINDLIDAGDDAEWNGYRGAISAVTAAINGGQNGISERTALWKQALGQGDALLTLLDAATTKDEDEMAGWTPELVDRAMVLMENQTGVMRPSLSPFRHVGEGNVNTCGGFSWSADGIVHGGFTAQFAVEYGDPVSILLLWEVAQNTDPNRGRDAELAKRVLAKVAKADLDNADTHLQNWLAAETKAKAA